MFTVCFTIQLLYMHLPSRYFQSAWQLSIFPRLVYRLNEGCVQICLRPVFFHFIKRVNCSFVCQRNEGAVWALLEEADKNAMEKPGEALVYEAMAVSLSNAWKTLVNHLEKRRSLLILACHFFECALEVTEKRCIDFHFQLAEESQRGKNTPASWSFLSSAS